MGRKIDYIIPSSYDGASVQTYLRTEKNVSAKLLHKLKTYPTGMICNGTHIRSIDTLHVGDRLTIELPEEMIEKNISPLPLPLDVLYEDEDILVINKPGDISMHESHNHQGDTLSNIVVHHLQQEGKSLVFRSVGRLDKGTSGVVVCALHAFAAAKLSGKIKKEYLAVIPGQIKSCGTIDKPIYRPDPRKTLRDTGDSGETAITHWQVLEETDDGNSLVVIHLETGRTHQIRVHFKSIGKPLIGDDMYGGVKNPSIQHQALHCATCRFQHPITEEELIFHAPIPSDFKLLL